MPLLECDQSAVDKATQRSSEAAPDHAVESEVTSVKRPTPESATLGLFGPVGRGDGGRTLCRRGSDSKLRPTCSATSGKWNATVEEGLVGWMRSDG